jgi:hypothetical protein
LKHLTPGHIEENKSENTCEIHPDLYKAVGRVGQTVISDAEGRAVDGSTDATNVE